MKFPSNGRPNGVVKFETEWKSVDILLKIGDIQYV
jgi:hypothetical protein